MSTSGAGWGSPVIVPDQPVLRLDDLGLYEVGYALRGGPEVRLPVGWVGGLDSPTGAACQPAGIQNGREAWLLHCPWRGKTGVTFQDFTVQMPRTRRIVLRGATALRADGVGKSDGATFRVFVDGRKRLDVNRADSVWQPFALDLTPDAGKTVTLRFETDPGPRDDPSFDFSLWGDRQLVLMGYSPHIARHPAPPPLDLRRLTSRPNGSVTPPSGFAGTDSVRVSATEAVFRYQGQDGVLEYHWTPGGSDALLGRVTLQAHMKGDAPVTVPLAGQAHLDWASEATLLRSALAGTTLTRTYSVGGQTATVTVTASLRGKSLVFDAACDRPIVRALDGGDWGPTLRRRQIGIPYYSRPIWLLARENLFAGAFLDWTASGASSLDGTRAAYDPCTDGTRNLLRERLVYTAAWHLAETLPNIPNPPSPFRADLSRRVVLDIWGGTFPDVQAHLRALADAGLGPAVALIHVWQFGGYDNMLPQHVPANAGQGGDPAMAALMREGKRDGIRMALHENYVDYYPNYPGFTDTDIARAPDGSRVPAWYNPGTKIQSFAVKPSRILALAATQSPEVVRRYGGDACYLDVHSAVPPWFHVDFQAGQPNGGAFRATWDAHRALWAYERGLHGGPVFGEGNNHWYWSGCLDGVEAQFGQGWRDGQGTSAPLLVDFDLLKIHPLQLNHGMGYYERWWERGPGAARGLLSLLDQYRMQEAAYGHEGFLGGEAWHDPALAGLEARLMTPLTARTALARPVAIDYWVGGHWADTTAAAKAGSDFARVRIRYDNGLTLWANGGDTPLWLETSPGRSFAMRGDLAPPRAKGRPGGVILPRYGWLARGGGLTAGTTLRGGVVSDLAETPDSVFVNARPAADWQTPGQTRIRPTVAQFIPTGPRAFRATYQWAVGQSLPADYHCFVHFVSTTSNDGGENIRFQQDHALPVPTSRWKPGQTITDGAWDVTAPTDVAPGDYLWTIGLFQPDGGRLTLQGQSDPHSRVILGTLHVAPDGGLSFTPAVNAALDNAPVNHDSRVLDFGSVRTNGSIFLRREGPDWVLRPFPRDRAFTVWLSAARFGHPAGARVTAGWWRLPLTGASLYRWPARKPVKTR
ncbi:MAG: hypothetical protein JO250_14495 [Armatimonadetes bacterium]|nr:hypothetical protein [Armatimonadota bacterium]